MITVAVVGASGLVGGVLRDIMEKSPYDITPHFYASHASAGKNIPFRGSDIKIIPLSEENIRHADAAIFCVSNPVSQRFVPAFVKKGIFCADNSSYYRMHKDIPLVVPEINGQLVHSSMIVANPNCTTAQSVIALKPVMDTYGLRRVIISSYQSASGAGMKGLNDLSERRTNSSVTKMPHQIFDNCIPMIGELSPGGYSAEELKQIRESRKILSQPLLSITCTSVRVPVSYCHCQSINVETTRTFSIGSLKDTIASAKGLTLMRDSYPMPIDAKGEDNVFVGRVRRDFSCKNAFNMWVVADNLRKGAALNAWQIVTYKFFGEY